MHASVRHLLPLALALPALGLPSAAQSPAPTPAQSPGPGRTLTTADYARAESRLAYRTNPLVGHTVTHPTFFAGNRFWFRDAVPAAAGIPAHSTYLLFDPATRSSSPLFDQPSLAAALAKTQPGQPAPDPTDLYLDALSLADPDATGHPHTLTFQANGEHLRCTLTTSAAIPPSASCTRDLRPYSRAEILSPDGHFVAFLRDWNLWLRDTRTGTESQLTRDGIPNFGYATDNAGWTHSPNPILVWSPDARHIATYQQDQRNVGTMTLVPTVLGHPQPETWPYPLVGDKVITVIERVSIDVPSGRVVRLHMPPDQHRSTLCDDISCGGGWDDLQWAPDSQSFAFVSTSRDHKDEWLRIANPDSGDVRTVFHEHSNSFLESGAHRVDWRYLPASNEFLWFTERTGWGELELHDLTTGDLKNTITTGDGNVTDLLSVDLRHRRVLYLAIGKDPRENPYFSSLYTTDLSGKDTRRLTPEPTNHAVTLSPDASLFVDISSTPTEPQVTTLRDTTSGKLVMPVARQDISALLATGWHPLTPITVKARDGQTDLYGYMFLPSGMDPHAHYPLIDYIYPGPQVGSCRGQFGFEPSHLDDEALTELGFVVICLDGIGTPGRSKSFHVGVYAQDPADNTLPDQVTAIRQLAARYPFIDLDRVGIWGHSGGGNATATAMFRFPDLFKVGISESGNHDQRNYEDDWAEKWGGLEHPLNNDPSHTESQTNFSLAANQSMAKNLRGHLFLLHGTMDDNVPPNNTLLLVDALIKANKDFDLLLIPNAHHAYGAAAPYVMRRRWDYFVRNLAGNTPPLDYRMTPESETRRPLQGPAY